MGADRALQVEADDVVQPLMAARVLLELTKREKPVLVILGKQAIDDDSSQTGQMLAALWDRPQATFASQWSSTARPRGDPRGRCRSGVIDVDLPAVITTDLRLNSRAS